MFNGVEVGQGLYRPQCADLSGLSDLSGDPRPSSSHPPAPYDLVRKTIQKKVRYAKQLGLGGVMIWEAGQDCRLEAVERHDKTHVVTCPDGENSSLLVAIAMAGSVGDEHGGGNADRREVTHTDKPRTEL